MSEKNAEDVNEETSDLVFISELIDKNSVGWTSDQAVNVETNTLIGINPGGWDKSDQTYMTGAAYMDFPLEGRRATLAQGAGGRSKQVRATTYTSYGGGLSWPPIGGRVCG